MDEEFNSDVVIPDAPKFSNLMKRFRIGLGMTQEQMARKVGCSFSMYQKAEIGLRMWGAEYNGRLEAAFGVPYRELYPRLYVGVPAWNETKSTGGGQ